MRWIKALRKRLKRKPAPWIVVYDARMDEAYVRTKVAVDGALKGRAEYRPSRVCPQGTIYVMARHALPRLYPAIEPISMEAKWDFAAEERLALRINNPPRGIATIKGVVP